LILLIDNYDSFVYNLARYLARLGQETIVRRNDALALEEVRRLRPAAIVLSPGPRAPAEAGICVQLIERFAADIPMLGVCLGHQALAAAFGARIARAREPMHGRSSQIEHDGRGVFAGLSSPLTACRYHSLIVSESGFPGELEIGARSEQGAIMALRHHRLPLHGVQFHPESILTRHGYLLLANFLQVAGLPVSDRPAEIEECCEPEARPGEIAAETPITF